MKMHKLLPALIIITLTSLAISPASAGLSYYEGYVVYDSDHPNTVQPYMAILKLQTASIAPNGITYTGFTQSWFGAGYYDCAKKSNCWTQASYQQDFPHLWNKYVPQPSFAYHALFTEFTTASGGTSGEWIFDTESNMWAALSAGGFDYSQVYQSVTGSPLPAGGVPTTTPTPTSSQGTIIVWSDPNGATVSVNDIVKGATTGSDWLSIDSDAGTYTVKVAKSGYKTFTQQVTVTGGAQAQVQARLTSLTGTPIPTVSATATPTPQIPSKAVPGFEGGLVIIGFITVVALVLRGKNVYK